MPILADRAGTKAPICARIAISAFCRRKVLLPAMLGPVTSQIRSSPRAQSLATKAPLPASAASTVGCRPPRVPPPAGLEICVAVDLGPDPIALEGAFGMRRRKVQCRECGGRRGDLL